MTAVHRATSPAESEEPYMHNGYRLSEHGSGTYLVQGPASNWVILAEGGEFTLIDGGYPNDTPLVLESIRQVGLDPRAAQAMLITHGHVDHTGAANYFAQHFDVPVLSSAQEHGQVLGLERFQVPPAQVILRAWRPAVFRWMRHVLRAGGAQGTRVPTAQRWEAELLAKLPGAPVAIPTPGHTPGHTAFLLPQSETLISGDALITGHALSAHHGPQMLHPMFHHHAQWTQNSLERLGQLSASLILPGHGGAFEGTPHEAVSRVGNSAGR
ncbi:MBL fold metallo-hydrolase [Glutamicibacter endophyticus]